MPDLTVTRVRSNGRYRDTNRVHSGDAFFSDGKDFRFSVLPGNEGDIVFSSYRKRVGGGERFSFKSEKRAQALAPPPHLKIAAATHRSGICPSS